GLAFGIVTSSGSGGPVLSWSSDPVTLTADEVLGEQPGDTSALEEGKAFLLETLGNGVRPAEEVDREAQRAGISKGTLKRAKKALGIHAFKVGPFEGGEWRLELPSHEGAQGNNTYNNLSPFEESSRNSRRGSNENEPLDPLRQSPEEVGPREELIL